MADYSTPEVALWLEKLPTSRRAIVDILREMTHQATPGGYELIYHDALHFCATDSSYDQIIYIAPFSGHVNLGFFFGSQLEDSGKMLVGDGKRLRHIKIKTTDEARDPVLKQLVKTAWKDGQTHVVALHHPLK